MLSLLSLLCAPALAADVLLPEFTAGSFSDFEAAERLTARIDDAITARRVSIDGPDIIFSRAEDLAVGCADESGCPMALLERLPARLAIVGKITSQDAGYVVTVRFYASGDPSPIETVSSVLTASAFGDFSEEMADVAESLLPLIPPLPGTEPVVTEPDPIEIEPDPIDLEPDPIEIEPDPIVVEEPLEPLDPEVPDDPRIAGLPRQAQAKYFASGLGAEEWLAAERVRVGQLLIEAQGGMAFGDVSRRYDTRISVSTNSEGELEQGTPYEYEDFIQGDGVMGGMGIGYVPVWWLETGVFVGLVSSTKELTTGWEQLESDQVVDEDNTTYAPTAAMLGVVEPKLRMFFVATGPIKPYAIGGLHLRIYDGYDVPDIDGKINYSNRPGGLGAGVLTGAGLALDGRGKLTGFIEVPWSYLFTPPAHYQAGEDLRSVPQQATGSEQLLMVRAGLGLRL